MSASLYFNPPEVEFLKAQRAAPKGLKGRSSSTARREETLVYRNDDHLSVLQPDILIIIRGAGADVRQPGRNQLVDTPTLADPVPPAINDNIRVKTFHGLHRDLQPAERRNQRCRFVRFKML